MRWSPVLAGLAVVAACAFASPTRPQLCPRAPQCRDTAPGGALLYNPTSSGRRVWTTPCGSSTNRQPPDAICRALISSPQTGGFGKFISAVSSQCTEKHFGSYFGLDGLTFGILDWTAPELPSVLRAYQLRSPTAFQRDFGYLAGQMHNQCLDRQWTCTANRSAALMCEPHFHAAFSSAVADDDFHKAEIDVARLEYEARLKRYESLGLRTEYGNTAMAVLANNLVRAPACRPAALVQVCGGRADEHAQVECILDTYIEHACRGSTSASRQRATAIRAAFKGVAPSTLIHPTAEPIERAVPDWGSR